MANYTINNLTELTGTAVGDFVPIWDTSAAVTRKSTLTNLFAAVAGAANTFTAGQVFAPTSTSQVPITITQPSGMSTFAFKISDSVGQRFAIQFISGFSRLYINDTDMGAGAAGSHVRIGRNSNASAGAGFIAMASRGGTDYRVWTDNTGVLRIHTGDPTNANDTAGTVVGAQTSMAEAKNLLGDVGDPVEALRAIISAARNGMKRFDYKSGAFNGEVFEGIVTDLAPRYGMDRDDAHPQGKALNEIQLLGDLVRAVAFIAEKINLDEDKK